MEGFILTGGMSSRMGRPKAEMMLGGITLLERAAHALGGIAGEGIAIVGGTGERSLGLQVLADPEITVDGERASGAIVGLYGALSAPRSEWIAVIACDLPFVSTEMFKKLNEYIKADVDAIVPMQPDGRPQPLAALYRPSTCAPAALSAIESGDRSLRSLLNMLNTRYLPFTEFSDLDHASRLFRNINSPEDHRRAVEMIGE